MSALPKQSAAGEPLATHGIRRPKAGRLLATDGIRRKIPWQWLLAALAAFLMAGIAAPFLSADSFRDRISKALEASLGRKVKIGAVRLDLFGGPGFTISDVEIADDPAFGIE